MPHARYDLPRHALHHQRASGSRFNGARVESLSVFARHLPFGFLGGVRILRHAPTHFVCLELHSELVSLFAKLKRTRIIRRRFCAPRLHVFLRKRRGVVLFVRS